MLHRVVLCRHIVIAAITNLSTTTSTKGHTQDHALEVSSMSNWQGKPVTSMLFYSGHMPYMQRKKDTSGYIYICRLAGSSGRRTSSVHHINLV